MADSNITKQALSKALKELMEDQSFEKISVSDICERCHMNRKSFYYHFRDKFDLANWTFDTEFVELIQKNELDIVHIPNSFEERWDSIRIFCEYFYENRTFYRKLLSVEGQNSFPSHFREFIHQLLRLRLVSMFGQDDLPQMVHDFLTDGILCVIERWLLEKQCVPVDEFLDNMKKLLQVVYHALQRRVTDDPKWLE